MRLDGKRALVTGASSGIGQACAVALAEAGAHVVCAARGIEKLQTTVAEMTSDGWSRRGAARSTSPTSRRLNAAIDAQPGFDIVRQFAPV